MTVTAKTNDVSPNNPCPFLRALVTQGMLPDDVASIGAVTETIVKVGKAGDGSPSLPAVAIRAIAVVANGLSPTEIARNGFGGLRLNALRNGPLDKKGAGSGILAANGTINAADLKRFKEFASDKTDANGQVELGLDAAELKRMMDANFERAKAYRRRLDRQLMDGEWPILLQVMGKDGKDGRYLSVEDVQQLFQDCKLPERMTHRLAGK